MKERLKRIGKVLFVSLLAALLITTNMLPVMAENQKIEQVELTVTIPLVNKADQTVEFSTEDSRYTVKLHEVDVWKNADFDPATEFLWGNEYTSSFEVEAAAGYELTADTIVLVNGSQDKVNLLGDASSPAKCFEFKAFPQNLGSITEAVVENVPSGNIGDKAEAYNYVGENYTVDGVWQKYDYDIGAYVNIETDYEFKNGEVYRLALTMRPNEGYIIDPAVEITVGEEIYYSDGNESLVEILLPVSYAQEISLVEIDKDVMPKVSVGDKFKESDKKVIKSTDEYKVLGYWCHYGEDMGEELSGTFKKGESYEYVLQFVAKEGYAFSEYLEISVAGETDFLYDYDLCTAQYRIRKSFAKIISQVELLDLPEAKIGAKVKKGVFDVKVPSNANYTAQASWLVFDEYYQEVPTKTFQDGKSYCIVVEMFAKSGSEFSETFMLDAYGIKQKQNYSDYTSSVFMKDFSFAKKIKKVEITGYKTPKKGDVISTDDLKTPKNAKYTIVDAYWINMDDYSDMNVEFSSGNQYLLNVSLVAKDGYEFSNSVTATIGGEEVEFDAFGKELYCYKDVSLKKHIKKVELENVPQMKIGKKATTKIDIPSNAKYRADATWSVWNENSQTFETFEGTFEKGEIYSLSVEISPNEGYDFASEVEFFEDGKKSEYGIAYTQSAWYRREFKTNQKVIDKVELKVEKYKIGHHSSIEPVVSVVGSKQYEVFEPENSTWLLGDLENFKTYDSYFEEDASYGTMFNIVAKEGYVFSEDLVVVVNGVTLAKDALNYGIKIKSIEYFFDMENSIIEEETDKADKDEEGKKEEILSPVTQDKLYGNILFIIAIISMACAVSCGYLLKKKS